MSNSHDTGKKCHNIHISDHRRQVAVVWGVADVQSKRPDLNDDDAWEVLRHCIHLNYKFGYTWLPIENVADEIFPKAE